MKWTNVEIRQVAEVASGFGFPRKYQGKTNEEVPFFKVGDMNLHGNERCMTITTNTISSETLKKLKAKAFPQGTIIFPKIGAAIATNKKRMLTMLSVVDNNVMGLIPSQHIEKCYLYYWMQQFDLRSISNIGPVPSMRKTEVEKILIPLPPISEQRRIVEILNQSDRLRTLRTDADAKAWRILPALFIQMFGDPATNPMGWMVGTLGDVCVRITDGTHQPPPFVENGIPFLFVQNIVKGFINLNTQKFITEETYENLTKTIAPQKGDILYSTVGSYGVAVVVDTNRLFLFQRHIGHLRPKGALMDSWFLCAQMNTPYVKAQADQRARGLAQKTLNLSEIRQFQVVIPPLVEQKKFSLAMQNFRKITGRVNDQEILIESLFKIILHRAFTGDLTASWREDHMKELLQEMEMQAKALAS